MSGLIEEIAVCRHCADQLPHPPRPVVQYSSTARLLIIGQAPGSKVHASGVPWDDASGARLCEWTGLNREQLHDPARVAIVPMGFCYPGKGKSGDLPPRKECAPLWHDRILAELPEDRLTLLVGMHAQKRYLPATSGWTMEERVRRFADFLPKVFTLPHPSWRSTLFMRRNPWFAAEVLPALREKVAKTL